MRCARVLFGHSICVCGRSAMSTTELSMAPVVWPVLSNFADNVPFPPLLIRFLNIRLDGIRVTDPERFPHMVRHPPPTPPPPPFPVPNRRTFPHPPQRQRLICACDFPARPRCPSRTASSEARSFGTCRCQHRRWTRRCWRMLHGEVSRPFPRAEKKDTANAR